VLATLDAFSTAATQEILSLGSIVHIARGPFVAPRSEHIGQGGESRLPNHAGAKMFPASRPRGMPFLGAEMALGCGGGSRVAGSGGGKPGGGSLAGDSPQLVSGG